MTNASALTPDSIGRPQIRVLFDGECPLCSREVALLRRRDRGRIGFEDIAHPDFDAGKYGLDQAALMARIHGVCEDGRIIEGVEVFRMAYTAVGLGWLVAPTRWPLLRQLAEAAYSVFAKNRLRWTGRTANCHCDRGEAANGAGERAANGAVLKY